MVYPAPALYACGDVGLSVLYDEVVFGCFTVTALEGLRGRAVRWALVVYVRARRNRLDLLWDT